MPVDDGIAATPTRLVIIRGHVFNYEEKAPYVPSGLSVLGAIEFDQLNDKLRCHECGDWFHKLAMHVRSHGTAARDYKIRHGLPLYGFGGLVTPNQTRELSERIKQIIATGRARKVVAVPYARRRPVGPVSQAARLNLVNRCDAQILFRIRVLAARVGHTPTVRELNTAGIDPGGFGQRLGNLQTVMILAGLRPNGSGSSGRSPLPQDFDSRMPWPVDYSRVNRDDAFRRMA